MRNFAFLILLTGILVMFNGWVSVIIANPKTKSTEQTLVGLIQYREGTGIRVGRFITIEVGVLIYRGLTLRGAGWAEAREQAQLRRDCRYFVLVQSLRLWAKIPESLLTSSFSTNHLLHNWQKRKRNFYLLAVPQWSTEKENQIIWVKEEPSIRVGLLKAKSSRRPLSFSVAHSFLSKCLFCALVRVTVGQRLTGCRRREKSFPKGIASLQKIWRNGTSDPQHPSVLCDWALCPKRKY